jgi:hypothetical protein
MGCDVRWNLSREKIKNSVREDKGACRLVPGEIPRVANNLGIVATMVAHLNHGCRQVD